MRLPIFSSGPWNSTINWRTQLRVALKHDAQIVEASVSHLVDVKPAVRVWVVFFLVHAVQHEHELLPSMSLPKQSLHFPCCPLLLRQR